MQPEGRWPLSGQPFPPLAAPGMAAESGHDLSEALASLPSWLLWEWEELVSPGPSALPPTHFATLGKFAQSQGLLQGAGLRLPPRD